MATAEFVGVGSEVGQGGFGVFVGADGECIDHRIGNADVSDNNLAAQPAPGLQHMCRLLAREGDGEISDHGTAARLPGQAIDTRGHVNGNHRQTCAMNAIGQPAVEITVEACAINGIDNQLWPAAPTEAFFEIGESCRLAPFHFAAIFAASPFSALRSPTR